MVFEWWRTETLLSWPIRVDKHVLVSSLPEAPTARDEDGPVEEDDAGGGAGGAHGRRPDPRGGATRGPAGDGDGDRAAGDLVSVMLKQQFSSAINELFS